ncbi:hypothetical protein, partial [Pseudomonas putida]|uniref:hypothetical protein n=1 Tax=Pseudomonas putida TaxID=303 RepID=UPI001EE92760
KRRLALPGQPPFLFQNVSVAAELKPYTSCLLRDSAARKGWVISYRDRSLPGLPGKLVCLT